jgi:hypothetical protein
MEMTLHRVDFVVSESPEKVRRLISMVAKAGRPAFITMEINLEQRKDKE